MARLARSLETLRSELNGFAPRRSKASDGWLGDPAHQARSSRHNPNKFDVVTAFDATHDPANGCDIHAIARRLAVPGAHPELEYVISNRQVAKRRNGFRWEPYRGANPHDKHAHFAVGTGPDSDPLPPYDSTLSWGVSLSMEDDMPFTEPEWKRLGEIVTWVVAAEVGKLRDRVDDVQGNLAALQRRVLGVDLMADGTEQHKADEDTGRRFQHLLGD